MKPEDAIELLAFLTILFSAFGLLGWLVEKWERQVSKRDKF